jgi:hypothetical protein
MDLTKNAPRSVKETMLGIVQLARTPDKAKAVVDGQVGEYHYDCPMDRALFDFLAMDPKEFLDAVRAAENDSEIEAYAKLSTVPTRESLMHFNELRAKIAPSRTDVTSWPDLLDLDEGRTVSHRGAVRA